MKYLELRFTFKGNIKKTYLLNYVEQYNEPISVSNNVFELMNKEKREYWSFLTKDAVSVNISLKDMLVMETRLIEE